MILVLASIVDEAAAAFASELGSATVASLLTCADLASAPLNLHHPNFEASTITVGGEAISVGLLTGVVNVLPVILPDEILFYDEAEREYQAAEMHALLTFFLTRVACPVINRATATSLTGPFLNPFGWRQLARSLGIAVANLQMRSDPSVNPFAVPAGSDSVEVACLGSRVIVTSNTLADERTIALAQRAGVEYLRVVYLRDGNDDLRYLTAHTIPDLSSAPTRAEIAEYFARRQP